MRCFATFLFTLVLATVVATPASAKPEDDVASAEPSNAPFRVALVNNAAVVRRASTTLATIAKQPVPARISKADRKLYEEQSRWLADTSARLAAVHTRMELVLAKGAKAPAAEVATMNVEFVQVREAIAAEAKRFERARARHVVALNALR